MYYTRDIIDQQIAANSEGLPVTYSWCGYKGRLEPTIAQEKLIRKTCGCARKVHNLTIDDWKSQYEEHKTSPEGGWRKLKEVSTYRNDPEMPYLKEVDSYAFANEKIFVKEAFEKFFSGQSGYPKYKSKHKDKDSYTTSYSHNNIYISEDGKYIKLPKLGMVRMHIGKLPSVPIKSVTITIEPSGVISVSFGVQEYFEEFPATGSITAMDLNMGDIVLTDGTVIEQPRYRRKSQEKLAKAQRKLGKMADRAKKEGRKLSDSKNYQKQKTRVAKLQAKVANQRSDFQHKLSREIVENQDIIIAEDLCLRGMMRNHSLAMSVTDAAYGEFLRQLCYKAQRYGKVFIQSERYYASTQLCSCCGSKGGPSGLDGLGEREWECPDCGAHHVRDVNSSWNELLWGLDWLLLPAGEWEYDGDGALVEPWRAFLDVDYYVLRGVLDFVRAFGVLPVRADLPRLMGWLSLNEGLVLRTAGMAGLACVPINGAGVALSGVALV